MFRDAERTARWLLLTLCLALLKLILYVYDSDPQTFSGDSGSYLTTALTKWIPPDRSFLYGFVVRLLTLNSHSLNSVVAFQTFAGLGTALCVAAMLTRFFQARFVIASVIATAVALEPQQVLYERFILTESLSCFAFTLFVLLALEYLKSRRLWTLIVLQITGIVLVAFRVTFVPVVLVSSIVLPLCLFVFIDGKKASTALRLRQVAIHFLISVLLFIGLHQAYQAWNGSLSKLPPAYTYADGFFLLSNVSPLVKPGDTDNAVIAEILRQPMMWGTRPWEWNARNAEMFSPGGLVPKIKKAFNDDYRANAESRRIARKVILRDPVGFFGLAFDSYQKFFSKPYMLQTMKFEAGMAGSGPDELRLFAVFHLDATELAEHDTVTRKYYLASWPYYILLIHTPLVLLGSLFVAKSESRKFLWFLLIIGTLHVVVVQTLGVEPSPRHNHAVVILLALGVGVFAERFMRWSPKSK
jgi:hypothetical protein